MEIKIIEESITPAPELARIPISFEVESVFDVTARGCRQLKIVTQNIGAPARRFLAREGCELGAINRSAYLDLPDEVQPLWWKAPPAA